MALDSMRAGQSFSIGGVISTSISVFFRNLVPFAIITALIGIPYILISLWSVAEIGNFQAAAQAGTVPSGFFGMIGVMFIVLILTNTLSQAAITYGTFQDLRGRRASFGDCLGRGLSLLPRVIIAALLCSLGIMIASLALVIPGIIVLLMWWVFVPAIVVEGAGITESFGRSRELTRGHRWAILGLLFVVGIAQWLVGIVVGFVGGLFGAIVQEILNLILTLGFTAFASVLAAVGYYYLRSEKEGIVIDDIARVFD